MGRCRTVLAFFVLASVASPQGESELPVLRVGRVYSGVIRVDDPALESPPPFANQHGKTYAIEVDEPGRYTLDLQTDFPGYLAVLDDDGDIVGVDGGSKARITVEIDEDYRVELGTSAGLGGKFRLRMLAASDAVLDRGAMRDLDERIDLRSPRAQQQADELDTSRLYTTRQEQRQAGLEREIFPWLTFSGLAEGARTGESIKTEDGTDTDGSWDAFLQIGLEADITDWAYASLIVGFDTIYADTFVEDASINFEGESWDVGVGQQYLPFGAFFSHFITDPLTTLGETQVPSAIMSYELTDDLDFAFSVYKGRASSQSGYDPGIDLAGALEYSPLDQLSLAMSTVTDIGDTDAEILGDFDDEFQTRVPGLSAYILWVGGIYEVSLEVLGAVGSLDELDSDVDEPWTWNLEFTQFPLRRFAWSLRYGGSRELEDAPETQLGAALNFRVHKYATLTAELLYDKFAPGLSFTDNDSEIEEETIVGIELSVVF